MAAEEDEHDELVREMKGNADRLTDCLSSLLKRIEQLETQRTAGAGVKSPIWGSRTQSPTAGIGKDKMAAAVLESRREYVSVDPLTGQRRLVTVLERQLPSGPLRAQSPTQLLSNGVEASRRLLANAYESRIVEVPPTLLEGLEVEQICGQLVAVKVSPELSKLVKAGDTLLELDGHPLTHRGQLLGQRAPVQLRLVLSDLYSAPMEFCRVLDDYQANNGGQHKALPYLSFHLQRGDILQVLSRDKQFFQARKVNDLSTSGFVPCNVRTRPVAMLCPFGRRVIVLLGANGVGRRTLKRMLVEHRPHQFAGVIPVTSRAAKPGEQQGREYQFLRKEQILQLIRDRQMVEWGEFNGQLYGTTAESVRQVVRSGRVCVLDCTARALDCLYNAEFMPFVVVVSAPPLDELVQLSRLHGDDRQKMGEAELGQVCQQSDRLLQSDWARQADLVLVNRNRDISLRRLLDALEALKNEPQWIPLEWIQQQQPRTKKAGG